MRNAVRMSVWNKTGKEHCEKLKIDFEIPEILEEYIDGFIQNLNEKGGTAADCYEEEIRDILNCCEDDLTEEQILLLRNYYCRGGIYE